MNRAERRREARESKKYGGGYVDMTGALKASIATAVQDKIREKQARDEAILATSGPMLKAVYASVILLMTEEYGFTHEQCIDLLTKLEDKTLLCLNDEEIVEEAFEKTGIRINFAAGVDRIEEIAT